MNIFKEFISRVHWKRLLSFYAIMSVLAIIGSLIMDDWYILLVTNIMVIFIVIFALGSGFIDIIEYRRKYKNKND